MVHHHRAAPAGEAAGDRILEALRGRRRLHRAIGESVARHVVEEDRVRRIGSACGDALLGLRMDVVGDLPLTRQQGRHTIEERRERPLLVRMPTGQDEEGAHAAASAQLEDHLAVVRAAEQPQERRERIVDPVIDMFVEHQLPFRDPARHRGDALTEARHVVRHE